MPQPTTAATAPREVPATAAALGYAGAIPFVAGCLAGFVPGWVGPAAIHALQGYGLAILAFMGGIHWGLALAEREPTLARLGASVVPPLVGWAAYLLGGAAGLWLLAAAFAGLLAYDLRATRQGEAPAWYPRLRRPLTAIVVACLLLGGLSALA